MSVPSLSLLDYTKGSPATRIGFLLELEQALREIGFVRFRDHGIPHPLLEKFYELLRIFFVDWTEEQRTALEQRWNGRQRGYGPFGCEHAAGTDEVSAYDRKAFFSTGVALDPSHPRFSEIAVNTYPNIPDFRRVNDTVYTQLRRVMDIIFAAVSEILGMGPDWLPSACKSGDCMQRGLYYPGDDDLPKFMQGRGRVLREQYRAEGAEITDRVKALIEQLESGVVPETTARSHAHTDICLGTILPRASARGLWALTRTGEKIEIHGDPEEVMYQNGDTCEDFSGGYLLSARHGVDNARERRINAVLFGHADRGTWVDIVPPMRDHATKSVTPATERRKLILRLHEIGHTGIPLPDR